MFPKVIAIRKIYMRSGKDEMGWPEYSFDHYEAAEGFLVKETKYYYEKEEPEVFFHIVFQGKEDDELPSFNLFNHECTNSETVTTLYDTIEEAKEKAEELEAKRIKYHYTFPFD